MEKIKVNWEFAKITSAQLRDELVVEKDEEGTGSSSKTDNGRRGFPLQPGSGSPVQPRCSRTGAREEPPPPLFAAWSRNCSAPLSCRGAAEVGDICSNEGGRGGRETCLGAGPEDFPRRLTRHFLLLCLLPGSNSPVTGEANPKLLPRQPPERGGEGLGVTSDLTEGLSGAPHGERVPEQYPRVPSGMRRHPSPGGFHPIDTSGTKIDKTFDANDLYQGQNFSKVLSSLVALNKVTADIGLGSDSVCARPSSHRIKSFDSLGSQSLHSRTSKLFQGQYRSLDMTDNSNQQLVVRAKFNFQQTNEDELSFTKGDIIHVTRVEEGGWWEGTHNGKTGWFPSNYVREVKSNEKPVSPKSGTLKSPPKGFDTSALSKSYYNVVLQNILETENEYAKELQTMLSNYLRPLQASEKLNSTDTSYLMGNLEEISSFQQMLVQSLEECTKLPEAQQRVGGCFLNLMPQMKNLYLAYCANHPSAVTVLTEHSEELGEFMEMKGANSPGILVLTTGLSKPFMRLDKYPTLLKELERHMEDYHQDRPDIQKSMTAFKNLSVSKLGNKSQAEENI
ncbi:Rho guanine nucleotide exchange factor 7 [Varanus komodoensis]|nr:Rho guanine nucleotide exchange factor 7 [Varanus komodoensis]